MALTLLQQVFTDMGISRQVCGLKRRVVSRHGYDKSIVVYIIMYTCSEKPPIHIDSFDLPMLESLCMHERSIAKLTENPEYTAQEQHSAPSLTTCCELKR